MRYLAATISLCLLIVSASLSSGATRSIHHAATTREAAPAPTAIATIDSSTMAAPWPQEPASFMGIRFGVPIREQFEPCLQGLEGADREINNVGPDCVGRFMDIIYLGVWHGPDIGVRYIQMRLSAAAGDTLEGLDLRFKRVYFQQMEDVLIAKFGKPREIETQTFANLAGAKLPGTVETWRGPNVTLELVEFGINADESDVLIHTKKLDAFRAAKRRDAAQANKDKL